MQKVKRELHLSSLFVILTVIIILTNIIMVILVITCIYNMSKNKDTKQ